MATEPQVIDRRESTSLALLDPQALISKAIETGSGIETMERLVALATQVREIQAKEAWFDAMAEFKAKCPPIYKSKTAKMKQYSYKFAPLEEICPVIDPVMAACGLTYRWTTPKIQADKVTVACIVSHRLGHSESSGDLEMPIMGAVQRNDGSGDGGANAMQRVGISLTYAKRYSLLAITGLAPEEDEDGHGVGERREAQQQDMHGAPPAGADGERIITEKQLNRFHAIARGAPSWNDEQLHELLTSFGLKSSKEIKAGRYEDIVEHVKGSYDEWKAKKQAAEKQATA
jgi:hypothetical protein